MNYIEIEDNKTLLNWLEEYNRESNLDKIILPNCIYNRHEIERELIRRENIKEFWRML
jgi:hypothetical protein